MTRVDTLVVVLIALCLALLALNAKHTGPEWSGASHVDGRP